jgi:peptidyl-prolyl cis-trans isomerase D
MFDLFRSRDKAMRYLLGVLLGLVALSMITYLIPGAGLTQKSPDQVVAEVNKEPITVRDVQVQLQQIMRNKSVPPEMIQIYLPQLIDQMITERAVAYQAKRMGFEVTDADTARAIRSVLAQLFPNGEFNKQVYEQFLSQQGLTITEFEDNIRKNLLLLKLRNIPLEGVVVNPNDIAQEYHRRNDKAKVEFVSFDPTEFKSKVTVTPAEEQSYFNANRTAFKSNEKRSFNLLIGDEAKIAASIETPEAVLRTAYETNKEKYRVQDRVKVRHILIKTMDKPKDQVSKLEAKANDLLKQIKSGGDFAALAKKNSEDPGSAAKGGDLDWIVRGQTVKPFEEAAFSLKPKEISNLIKTEYGYHIIQVMDKEQGRLKPFEEVKTDLTSDLKRQQVVDRLQTAMDQARVELMKAPQDAENIARRLNLIYVKADKIGPGESVPEVGTNHDLDASIASLKPGEVTPVFQLGPSKLGVAELTGIEPVKPAEFVEVEPQIKKQLIDQKASQMAQQKMAEATAKLTAPGADFRAAAKSLGLDVKTTDSFSRDGAAEGIGPATYIGDAFVKPVGSVFGPMNAGDKMVICKIVERLPADEGKLASMRDDILLTLKKKKANERRELFEDGLLAELIKQGKVKKYPDAIKRLEQSYRS